MMSLAVLAGTLSALPPSLLLSVLTHPPLFAPCVSSQRQSGSGRKEVNPREKKRRHRRRATGAQTNRGFSFTSSQHPSSQHRYLTVSGASSPHPSSAFTQYNDLQRNPTDMSYDMICV